MTCPDRVIPADGLRRWVGLGHWSPPSVCVPAALLPAPAAIRRSTVISSPCPIIVTLSAVRKMVTPGAIASSGMRSM